YPWQYLQQYLESLTTNLLSHRGRGNVKAWRNLKITGVTKSLGKPIRTADQVVVRCVLHTFKLWRILPIAAWRHAQFLAAADQDHSDNDSIPLPGTSFPDCQWHKPHKNAARDHR